MLLCMLLRMLLRAVLPPMCTLTPQGAPDSAAHAVKGFFSLSLQKRKTQADGPTIKRKHN
jgi:hypothetical protein